MNLGAFMDPEYPIFSTTLCYLERDDAYLMLHRIKKQDDYNHDKWVGVGGKFERFESPEDCLVREVREETGLTLTRWRCRGLLTFVWGNMTEFIHLYTADRWEGEMIRGDACAEGELQWVQKSEVQKLPIWEGDKIFFRLLEEEHPYFSLKLVYDGDTLIWGTEPDGKTPVVTTPTTKPAVTTTTTTTTTTVTTDSEQPGTSTTTTTSTTAKPGSDTNPDVLYGDVNVDGKVSLVDAVMLNKAVADQVTLSDAAKLNADCQADGEINGNDSITLLRFLVKLENSLPVLPVS